MEISTEYYTYTYLRENGTPYYIGKGKGNRMYNRGKKDIKPPKDKSRILILKQNLTEEEAFKHEIYMIDVFGRKDLRTGILRNKTNGGEGLSVIGEETRIKLSEANRGRNNPMYGKSPSKETRKKQSEANKGRTFSDETRKKLSEVRKGKTLSEETKIKLSKLMTGRKCSKKFRKKISDVNKGKKWWNNGKVNKFSIECPDEGWVPGMVKRQTKEWNEDT
jgi:hypothetical protein